MNQDEELECYKKTELLLTIRNEVIYQQNEILESRAKYIETENKRLEGILEKNRSCHSKELDLGRNELMKIVSRWR